jgi:hypothetical protein
MFCNFYGPRPVLLLLVCNVCVVFSVCRDRLLSQEMAKYSPRRASAIYYFVEHLQRPIQLSNGSLYRPGDFAIKYLSIAAVGIRIG